MTEEDMVELELYAVYEGSEFGTYVKTLVDMYYSSEGLRPNYGGSDTLQPELQSLLIKEMEYCLSRFINDYVWEEERVMVEEVKKELVWVGGEEY